MILDPYEKIEEQAILDGQKWEKQQEITRAQYERLRAYNEMVNNAMAADFAAVVNKKIIESITEKWSAYDI